jgi:hypothetical protein
VGHYLTNVKLVEIKNERTQRLGNGFH